MEVFKQALELEPSRVETICSYVRESLLHIQSTHPATGLSSVQEMVIGFNPGSDIGTTWEGGESDRSVVRSHTDASKGWVLTSGTR